ncbi:hypothetical protein P3X46_012508 [Hevea brasiliensis]|uniref:RING-type E3 ubiquitin transferase n=1 Tax=Hevea brasiliensis TaxID=3981 RepID=A0ABQ9MAE9_HEVBR|nr:probable E3 ubiquitin-protein ligase RHG1A [Hevea brasiliensis]XP_021637674.2 probable E3 ubiquitin-protein ligase RHG1A [Hevea brasiliensis]XP_058006171.1 probable E3 ubiquitin-protein ligase RHG1A [Hevea brasiliensis]KAJ9177272.1 hypothetical protein P3X46_012508 [Hevea brasiliensis]
MQGQDSTSNAFPGTFYLDNGSNGINLRQNENNVVPADASVYHGHPVMGWMSQSSSSMNNQTLVRFRDLLAEDGLPSNGMDQSTSRENPQSPVRFLDLLAEDGLLSNGIDQSTSGVNTQTPVRFQDLLAEDSLMSSPVASPGTGQSLEERHSGPLIAPFRQSVDMSLGNGCFTNRLLPLQQASSSAFPQNLDLNAAFGSNSIDANLNTVTDLCPSTFKPGGSDVDKNLSASDSSNSSPLVISSGIAGYVVEENEDGEGRSPDGRRLSCKRRAAEDASGQLSLGRSSRSTQQAVPTQENNTRRLNLSTTDNHPNVRYSEQLDAGVAVALEATPVMHQTSSAAGGELGARAVASSYIHQALAMVGEAEQSQRNIHLRRRVNHQDFVPANFATWTARNSPPQLRGQPAVHSSLDFVPNTSSVTRIVHPTPPMQQPVHDSYSSETLQQGNAITRSRTVLPSTSVFTVNRGDATLLEDNSRNNQRNDMLTPEFQRGNLEHLLTNPNFVLGTNSPGNIASNSRNSSTFHVRQSSAPILFPESNMAQQYMERTSDIVNDIEAQRQGSYYPRHLGIAEREWELSMRGGNSRAYHVPLRSGLTIQAERQSDGNPDVPMRSLTATQRRMRLLSELRVHNAVSLLRRERLFQYADLLINRSVLFGVPEENDLHEDMRLDVDNMSYEELLALEERIGNVCTGLSEEAIQAHMKPRKYEATAVGPLKDEPCCICQEDYADGEDLGQLNCGHEFHFNCIKQWLVQKNNCPICKKTGFEV